MVRVAAKLLIIFLLVSAGVYLWYGRLEKRLLAVSAKPVPSQADKTTSASRAVPEAVGPITGTDDFQIIVSRNIFQASLEKVVEKAGEVVEEVLPTSLNLTLLGTVTGDPRDARAIIVDNKKRQQELYQIGDAVQGAFIESIERGRVTLDVNGRKEALLIKDREGGGPGPPKVAAPSARVAPENKPDRKKAARKVPRTRPHRRISFRQDAGQQSGSEPEGIDADQPAMALDQEPDLPADTGGDEELLPVE